MIFHGPPQITSPTDHRPAAVRLVFSAKDRDAFDEPTDVWGDVVVRCSWFRYRTVVGHRRHH